MRRLYHASVIYRREYHARGVCVALARHKLARLNRAGAVDSRVIFTGSTKPRWRGLVSLARLNRATDVLNGAVESRFRSAFGNTVYHCG